MPDRRARAARAAGRETTNVNARTHGGRAEAPPTRRLARPALLLWAAATLLLAPGCERALVGGVPRDVGAADGTDAAGALPPGLEGPVALTTVRDDGNRLFTGALDLGAARPVDVVVGDALPGAPRWVLGAPLPDGSVWVVVDQYGTAAAWSVRAGAARPIEPPPDGLPPGTPPVLWLDGETPRLLPPPAGAAPLAPPLPHALAQGQLAWILADGTLAVSDGRLETHLPLAALPDARIVRAGPDCLAVLGSATDLYPHGVLGDALEGGALYRVCNPAVPRVRGTAPVPLPRVAEALGPLAADIDGDAVPELILVESDATEGARVVALDSTAARLAEGRPVGEGGRWRHVIAVAPFAPDGAPEIAVVRTPHIGGTVEFWRRDGFTLRLTASLGTYTSHVFGSRNLDMALAGDLDADGRPELLVLSPDRRELAVIDRTAAGAAEGARVPADGVIATNLAVAGHGTGLALAAAREDRVLRLWLPAGAALDAAATGPER